MRFRWLLILALAAGFSALAQTPPANAKDITELPSASTATPATESLPSAQVSAPPNMLRIYVDTLNGSDASALAGLITQTLFESKQVVVTNQRTNASLILQGSVVRQPIPPPTASTRSRRRPAATPDTAAPPTDSGLSEVSPADMALLNGLSGGVATDTRQYRYRLDLQVYNPNGDLVWMSGQGQQALPYEQADQAVQNTLKPLLTIIATWTPAPKP